MNKTNLLLIGSLILLCIIISCSVEKTVPTEFETAVEELKLKHAPDKRIAYFSVQYHFENDNLIIEAESNILDALEELKSLTSNILEKDSYTLQISQLPSKELEDNIFGIVRVSSANIYREAKFSSEIIDQGILGSVLKILKKDGSWYFIQTNYDYLGWMKGGYFTSMSQAKLQAWQKSKKIQVINKFSQIYSEPHTNSFRISDAVFGSVCKYISQSGKWVKIELPDGAQGFIQKEDVGDYNGQTDNLNVNRNTLIAVAKKMIGIPYFWGGNSTKGLDCSGFTQTVFESQGYLLPRDANMQVNLGSDVNFSDNFEKVREGDLLFFGPNESRITHVGISLGKHLYIHSGSSEGQIRINSLKPGEENFNEGRLRRLRRIKRIINE